MTNRLKDWASRVGRWLAGPSLADRSLAVQAPDPVPAPRPVGSFTGLSHVHDELVRRLAEQRDTADKLDGKANGLIALLAVALGAAVTLGGDVLAAIPHAQTVIAVLLGFSLVAALAAYWPRGWLTPPNPDTYVTYVHWTAEQAQLETLEGLYAAIVVNSKTMEQKLGWLDWCYRALIAVSVLFVLTVALHLEKVKL